MRVKWWHAVRSWWELAVIGLLASALGTVVTRRGAGLDADSATYLGAAHNLLHGRGLTTPFTLFVSDFSPHQAASFNGAVPLTHYPPLYPVVLGGFGALGMSLSSAARVLDVVLIGVNVALVGLLARRLTGSRVIAAAVALVLLVGPVFGDEIGVRVTWLRLHSVVMSEPLFLTFSLLSLLALLEWLEDERAARLLATASFASLAFLCRYAGIAIIFTAAAVILLWSRGTRTRRLRAAGTVVAIGCAPGFLWALYGSVIEHGNSARSLGVHAGNVHAWHVAEGWLVPSRWPVPLRLGALAVAVLLIAITLLDPRRRLAAREPQILVGLRSLAVFVVIYAAVVVATIDFVDLSTPLNDRILAPVQPVFYILLFSSLWHLSVRKMQTVAPATWACVVLALLVASSGATSNLRLVSHGLPRSSIARSTTEYLRKLPAGTFIATNSPDRVFLDFGRPSIRVPTRTSGTSGTNKDFRNDVRDLAQEVKVRRGLVVLFPPGFGGLYLAQEQDLTNTTLRVGRRLSDGTVILMPS